MALSEYICEQCGTPFKQKHSKHKNCSPACSKLNHLALTHKWQKENAEFIRGYEREKSKDEKRRLYRKEYALKRTFGITLEQYNQLLENQGGGCAVCGKTPEEEKRALAVDHDHKTLEIFGLLCTFCNHRLIGKNRDPDRFRKASEYLSKGTGLFIPKPIKRKRRRKSS